MHPLLLLIPLLLPSPALAGAVHKCLGEDGVPSYQSQPCGPAQRTAWTRAAPPAAPAATAPARVVAAPPSPARAAPTPARRAVVRRAEDPVARRCAAARRAADLTRDRLWNRLSFRQRSELDQKVAYACRR